MTSLEKILKHNIFFTSLKRGPYHNTIYTIYKSNTIYDLASLNMTNSIDLVEKLTPFFYYLSGEYLERKKDDYFNFFVGVFFPDDVFYYST